LPWCVHGFIIIYHYFVFVFISGGFFVERLKIQIFTHNISTYSPATTDTYLRYPTSNEVDWGSVINPKNIGIYFGSRVGIIFSSEFVIFGWTYMLWYCLILLFKWLYGWWDHQKIYIVQNFQKLTKLLSVKFESWLGAPRSGVSFLEITSRYLP
jgi:hypothetical protein